MKNEPIPLVLVVDAQRAFCDLDGSLARAFGQSELTSIILRLADLDEYIRLFPYPDNVYLIRSEYEPGQFTGGDLKHPFAYACVPSYGNDCEWSLSSSTVTRKRVLTKTEMSAMGIPGFAHQLQSLVEGGLRKILVTGFLTTSCVKKTALDLRHTLPASVEVRVIENLCGSRASNYTIANGELESTHTRTLSELKAAGIRVSYDTKSELAIDKTIYQSPSHLPD